MVSGSGYNVVRRFRNAFIGLLAASLALHFWTTNVTLNLTDTIPAHKYETDTERLRKPHFASLVLQVCGVAQGGSSA